MKKTKLLILSLLTLASSSMWGQEPWTDVTEQYIKNPRFEEAPITFNVSGELNDESSRIGTTGWVYTITNWSNASVINNNAAQISTCAYDQTATVANGQNSTKTPSADNNNNGGACMHMSAGWGDDAIVTQESQIPLPAGKYKYTYHVYNQHTNVTIADNFCGVKVGSTSQYGKLLSATQGQWVKEEIEFSVPSEQTVTFSLGFTTSTSGSGNGAKLYVDNITLQYNNTVDKTNLNALITEANTIYSNDATGANEFDNAIKTASEINTKENATIAEVLSAEAALQTAIETYLSANNTNIVVNGTFDSNTNGWTSTTGAQNNKPASNKDGDFTGNFWENWNASPKTGKMYQKNALALPAGNYLMRIAAFGDQASEGSNLYVYAYDQKTAVVSDVPTYYYVPFTLTANAPAGTIEFGLTAEEGNKSGWLGIDNVSIYFLDGMSNLYALEADYTALAEALSTVSNNVFGFEAGEYAPYNNVEVAKAVAFAKTIDSTAKNIAAEVRTATDAIINAVWVVNETEVNAIYDGTFANAAQDGAPAGWIMSNNTLGGATHSRTFVGDDRLSEFNSTKSGFFMRFDGTNSDRGSMYYYGKTTGYTMPLKANTTYYVSVDAKNWGNKINKPLMLNVTGPAGFTAQSQQLSMESDADTNDDAPQNFFIVFTTTDAGNYEINFQCPGSDDNKHMVVISNVELMKAASANMTVTDAKWATFVAPFDVTIPNGVTASKVESATGNTLNLTAVETTIPANTPVVLNSESPINQTFYGKAVAGTPTAGYLTGVYANATVPKDSYVLVNREGGARFVVVGDVPATVPANRAYLKLPASEVKEFVLEDATGINSVNVNVNENETMFNLNGIRVNSDYKGIVIKNGKKQLNK